MEFRDLIEKTLFERITNFDGNARSVAREPTFQAAAVLAVAGVVYIADRFFAHKERSVTAEVESKLRDLTSAIDAKLEHMQRELLKLQGARIVNGTPRG